MPRRQLDPEDILDIVRRNKSWIAGPALAGLVIAVVVAFLWPDTYVSTAVIRVVPPQVPRSFVPSNVATGMSERINSMAQSILSRATLGSIIETYGLYVRQRQSLPMEDIIEDMRKDIKIGHVRNIQPKDQWQSAKNDLDAIEQKLTEFRVRNAGQLPDQWALNMQQLSALEARISSLNGEAARLNQDKLVLESRVRIIQDRIKAIMNAPVASGEYVDARLARYDEQIRLAERTLAALLENYTPNHPDVKRYEGQIRLLRKERKEYLAGRAQASPEQPDAVKLAPAQAAELRRLNEELQDKQIQIRARELDIENVARQIKNANERLQAIQKRLQAAPYGQQEYADLLRDYEMAKRRYDELNVKKSQSEIATDLENRKQGETLELLDPASLPETPTQPMRAPIILLGLLVGTGLGGALVFFREVKDTSLKTLKDVRAYTQLAVLGSIPLLENDLVVMRRRRMAWLAWTTACLFALIAMAGSVYYYYATKV